MNSHTHTNPNGYIVLSLNTGIQIRLRFGMANSINTHLRYKTQNEFLTLNKYYMNSPNQTRVYKKYICIAFTI